MAERVVESEVNDIPEIDDTLESVMIYALKEARTKLEAGEEVVPFTALAIGENLFMESHPGDSVEDCFAAARHTVQNVRGADAYAFCYDGYVDTDAGTKDVLIAEGGVPGDPAGYAIGYLYSEPEDGEGNPKVESEPVYIGPAPNFMEFTNVVPEDEDIDELDDLDEEDEDDAPIDPEDA